MSTFTLYRDLADLLTIVREDGTGWPGAYWSTELFYTDAWAISRRRKTELARPTAAWARRLEWPEPIARWSRSTGELIILDDMPGQRAERYLGMVYAPERWASLGPDAFAVAIRAAASCPLTAETANQALTKASRQQLDGIAVAELKLLRPEAGMRSSRVVR
jgi:hypothetical protein